MASRLQDVLLQGLAAARPLATAVAVGTLYYSTDTFVIEQSDGSVWSAYSSTSAGITQLTGDVTAGPGSGSLAATIPNDTVTYAKMQNVSATDRLLGLDSAGPANVEEIPVSSGLEFTGGPGLRTTVAVRTQQIGITVDGGGTLLTVGSKGFKSFPVAGTITGWRLLADAAGDIQFDVLKADYATFPTMSTIVAAAPPALSGVQKDEDTVGTWTTAVAAGDVFEFEITGTPVTITRVTLELTIVVT